MGDWATDRAAWGHVLDVVLPSSVPVVDFKRRAKELGAISGEWLNDIVREAMKDYYEGFGPLCDMVSEMEKDDGRV